MFMEGLGLRDPHPALRHAAAVAELRKSEMADRAVLR